MNSARPAESSDRHFLGCFKSIPWIFALFAVTCSDCHLSYAEGACHLSSELPLGAEQTDRLQEALFATDLATQGTENFGADGPCAQETPYISPTSADVEFDSGVCLRREPVLTPQGTRQQYRGARFASCYNERWLTEPNSSIVKALRLQDLKDSFKFEFDLVSRLPAGPSSQERRAFDQAWERFQARWERISSQESALMALDGSSHLRDFSSGSVVPPARHGLRFRIESIATQKHILLKFQEQENRTASSMGIQRHSGRIRDLTRRFLVLRQFEHQLPLLRGRRQAAQNLNQYRNALYSEYPELAESRDLRARLEANADSVLGERPGVLARLRSSGDDLGAPTGVDGPEAASCLSSDDGTDRCLPLLYRLNKLSDRVLEGSSGDGAQGRGITRAYMESSARIQQKISERIERNRRVGRGSESAEYLAEDSLLAPEALDAFAPSQATNYIRNVIAHRLCVGMRDDARVARQREENLRVLDMFAGTLGLVTGESAVVGWAAARMGAKRLAAFSTRILNQSMRTLPFVMGASGASLSSSAIQAEREVRWSENAFYRGLAGYEGVANGRATARAEKANLSLFALAWGINVPIARQRATVQTLLSSGQLPSARRADLTLRTLTSLDWALSGTFIGADIQSSLSDGEFSSEDAFSSHQYSADLLFALQGRAIDRAQRARLVSALQQHRASQRRAMRPPSSRR